MIMALLAIVFLGQQTYFQKFGPEVTKTGSQYLENGKNWFDANIYPRAANEAQKRGEEVKKEVAAQKDVAAQNLWEKIKSYFAEKFSNFSGTKVE